MSAAPSEHLTRVQRCEEHGLDFVQLFHPRQPRQEPFWSGQCERCAEDEQLSTDADYLLQQPEETAEIARKVSQIVGAQEFADNVQKLTDERLAAYIAENSAEWRNFFEAKVREERSAEVTCDVEF